MPLLTQPDGAEIDWQESGNGASVLVANLLHGYPGMVSGLVADLSADHRVITYDLRGTGGSSRRGPYDVETDIADLESLLEHVGGVSVSVSLADASLRAVRIAAARPDLMEAVVAPGTHVLAAAAAVGTDALTASGSVLKAMVKLLETDYRAGIRSMVDGANPTLSEEEIRDRVTAVVEHASQESVVGRVRAWIRDDATEAARALGDRLWVLDYPGNPWFPPSLAERMPEVLPEANYVSVEDGPMTRPDLTAGIVRGITGAKAASKTSRFQA